MLTSLAIRDILIIDRLSLAFGPGLNALTGETGAGKSILLDALGLALGWRGRAEVVRLGAAQGEVEAVFALAPGHPARAVLDEAGIEAEDDLILRRIAGADGRKTAFVNDRRTSAEVLRALSETLVELHGQHDERGLLNPRGHRALLDAFAGLDTAPCRGAWADLTAARQAVAEAEAALAAARAEEEFLRHAVAELDRLAPEPGEDAALDALRRTMQGAARIQDDVARAQRALGEEGAERLMSDAARWLEAAADRAEGRLDAPLAALVRAAIELNEAVAGVESALEALSFDPGELERAEERLFAIRALARKHSVAPDDLSDHADRLRGRLAALDGGTRRLDALAVALRAAGARHAAECARLTAVRTAAANRLDAAMAAELPPLKLERARFETVLSAADPGPEGADAVTFTVATNPGAPAGPLDRIASGGELSRFLLALKVCLAGSAPGQAMIFDEIDRGVGGATAAAVGRRLQALAAGAQVLVVTHSPQVAALAGRHFRVEKQVAGGATLTTVTPLDPAGRVDEIARMLAGDTVTDAARGAARELLAG
ncbi:MAG TPA: DNA repair protein RecN [Paracoccaceae bacterium]|nr:DNA repair protein RecN [Paracoccaceae bacterium]HMO72687.1 DNA repair protein RecN [Paracoccaceae bacterium]